MHVGLMVECVCVLVCLFVCVSERVCFGLLDYNVSVRAIQL